ncbi:MAG: CBS domain-containing protein [Desulfurococcaceae archaeon]|nr:CBS domain-containing protein [Desulfurococcaceae archaeon]
MGFRPKARPYSPSRLEHYRWMREGTPNFDDRVFKHLGELEVIAKRDVNYVYTTTPVDKALEKMASSHRSLVVLSSGKFAGLLTAMNFVNYLGGGELFNIIEKRHNYSIYSALQKEPVESIMEKNPVYVYVDEGIREALTRMVLYGAGILPVLTRSSEVYGVLTEHDFVSYLAGLASFNARVRDYMSKPVITVTSTAKLKTALETMTHYGFRRLPVLEDSVVTGILTAVDVVRFFKPPSIYEKCISGDVREVLETPVSEIMVKDLATVHPDDDLSEAVKTMLTRNVSSVLVVDDEGVLEGILTERDVLYAILAPK